MALAGQLARAWYGGGHAPWWCAPLAVLYGTVTRLRRQLYRWGWLHAEALPAPVVVVGNISVGGTGKTPLTIALVEALRARGRRPGVVSRGHGGDQHGPLLLKGSPDPARVGDEPCLMHASGLQVAVGRDRPAAARLLLEAGCDVIVADDGLQHYRLARDVEICVIDGMRRFGNGRLLPLGPLREPLTRLRGVDFRVCNGGVAEPGEVPMRLDGARAQALDSSESRSLTAFRGQRVHAVAGIGNPARFFDSLRSHGLTVIEHPFADHHAFVATDLDFGDGAPVLMTAKDAVKCCAFARSNCWSVPVRAELPSAFFDALDQRIARLAGGRRPR